MINRALAADLPPDAAWDVTLLLPPWVPPSEVAQVEARLAGWVASLRRPALQPLLEQLRQATLCTLCTAPQLHAKAPHPQLDVCVRGCVRVRVLRMHMHM